MRGWIAKHVTAWQGALVCAPIVAPCGSLQVDFGKTTGPVKPVNGVGQGPLLGWDNTKMFSVLPPKDFAKWARICEHVVAHYTKGWAKRRC